MRLSKNQIDKLGERLKRTQGAISRDDREMFAELLIEREASMLTVEARLAALVHVPVTTRLKTIGTTIEKLQRETSRLSQIQDVAGARLVIEGGRRRQDEIVARIVEAFGVDAERDVHDRRVDPSHGYRAVHVVVRVDGTPLEIQVRTELQHRWAELLERLADRLGRGIRYGLAPEPLVLSIEDDAGEMRDVDMSPGVVSLLGYLANRIDANETEAYELEQLEAQVAEMARVTLKEQLGDGFTDEHEAAVVDMVARAMEERREAVVRTHHEIIDVLQRVAESTEFL